VKVYVCWDDRTHHPVIGAHPCGLAVEAVREAGWEPEVVRAYGWKVLPDFLNFTPGRREVRRLTGGDNEVPIMVTDDGTVIAGSREIIAWAEANPASAAKASRA
jgi:hypothetical protein